MALFYVAKLYGMKMEKTTPSTFSIYENKISYGRKFKAKTI